jgi:hypothetical protein
LLVAGDIDVPRRQVPPQKRTDLRAILGRPFCEVPINARVRFLERDRRRHERGHSRIRRGDRGAGVVQVLPVIRRLRSKECREHRHTPLGRREHGRAVDP